MLLYLQSNALLLGVAAEAPAAQAEDASVTILCRAPRGNARRKSGLQLLQAAAVPEINPEMDDSAARLSLGLAPLPKDCSMENTAFCAGGAGDQDELDLAPGLGTFADVKSLDMLPKKPVPTPRKTANAGIKKAAKPTAAKVSVAAAAAATAAPAAPVVQSLKQLQDELLKVQKGLCSDKAEWKAIVAALGQLQRLCSDLTIEKSGGAKVCGRVLIIYQSTCIIAVAVVCLYPPNPRPT